MDPGIVVIGRAPCETSQGELAVGERCRLPLVEALCLVHANTVELADWKEQQHEPAPPPRAAVVDRVLTAMETVVETVSTAVKPKRRRYRRRDLQAEE